MSSEVEQETERGEIGAFVDDPAEEARSRATVRQGLFGGTAPPVHIGRYVVLGTIGQGGMGVVYRAYDPQLDRKVALKLVHVDASAPRRHRARARLLREGQAMARVAHPNVVPVFDSGTHGEDVFIAMEYVDGTTLREWLRSKPRRWREIVAVCSDAARGLAAAHHAKLLHRDFKPGNVLVAAEGASEKFRARVLDFGLARALEQRDASSDDLPEDTGASSGEPLAAGLTELGAVVGTPAYMAPERLSGGVGDERSDQYSFAVALYEALAGRHPFPVPAGRAPRRFLAVAPLTPPPRIAAVPRWLDRVVARGLAAEPDDRWPSMDAFIAALGDDPWIRVRRWAIVALAVLLVTVLARELWAWTRPGELRIAPTWHGERIELARIEVDEVEQTIDERGVLVLDPGLHRVRVHAEGFRPAEAIVEVVRGVAVDLPLPLEHEEGTLDIEVEPQGATIVIDGIEHGSPLRGHRIDTGAHEAVVLEVGSYERRLALDVRANEPTRAFVALPPGLLWSEPETGVNTDLVWLGDVDGDGTPELAHRNFNEVTAFDPWHGEREWSVSFGSRQGERTVWGELDGDGVLDLVALHHARGELTLSAWSARMQGREPAAKWSHAGASTQQEPPAPVIVDADGDGDGDVIAIGVHERAIEAFDGKTGAKLWSVAGEGTPLGLAAARDRDGLTVLALDDRVLRRIAIVNGRARVEHEVPSPWRNLDHDAAAAPTRRRLVELLPGGGDALVVTRTGIALLDERGGERWHADALDVQLLDAMDDGRPLVLVERRDRFALFDRSGQIRWEQPREGWLGAVELDGRTRVVTRAGETVAVRRASDLALEHELTANVERPDDPFAIDWDGDGEDELGLVHEHGLVAFDRSGTRVAAVHLELRPSAIASTIDANGDGVSDVLLESNGPQLVAGPRILWRRRATDAIRGAAIVRDFDGDARLELAVFAAFGGPNRLQLLDAETGIIEASASAGGEAIRGPAALRTDRGHDIVHVIGSRPTRFSGSDASVLATGAGQGTGYATPTIAELDDDGRLELAWVDWNGRLSVWDADSLAHRFEHALPAGSWAPPLVLDAESDGDPDLVVSLLDGTLLALAGDGSRELWRAALGARNAHAPLVVTSATETLLVTTAGAGAERRDLPQDLVGIAARDGRELWRWPNEGWARTRPVELDVDRDGVAEIVHGTREGAIVARDLAGIERWRDVPEREVDVSTALVVADLDHDGRAEIIAGYDDGRVRVLDGSSGRRLWTFSAGDEIESPPLPVDVDGDGVAEIVVGSHDRFLYCLRHISGPA